MENYIYDDREKIDVEEMRYSAAENIRKNQKYNEVVFNKKHKIPKTYAEGEKVMITNVDTTIGVNKKLVPKYRGPYQVKKIIGNDRYLLTDVPGFQVTQKCFEGIFDSSRMKPWISHEYEILKKIKKKKNLRKRFF